MENITLKICLFCLLGCFGVSYSFASDQCIPKFSEESHDNGEIFRHVFKLREDIKQKLYTDNQEGISHPALQQTYLELDKLTVGKTYIDIASYTGFLENNVNLFKQKGIEIDSIPTSVAIAAEKIGSFTLPASENGTYKYVRSIKEQLDRLIERNTKQKIVYPLTNELSNQINEMVRTSQVRHALLKKYIVQNYIHLAQVGVVDPSLITH